MGFQDDWIMRQIEIITRYVVRLVFGRDDTQYTMEVTDGISVTDEIGPPCPDGLLKRIRM